MRTPYTMIRVIKFLCSLSCVCILSMCTLFFVQPTSAAASDQSYIRVIHASPDIGTVDVFVDGTKFLSSFQYASVTNYASLFAGKHTVQIALIGKGINAAVISQTLAVEPGTAYTVAATGLKSTHLALTVFKDDNSVVGNDAKVRVYHLSPGTGTVDVDTATVTNAISIVGYQQASTYLSVPAGTYTFHLKPALMGTTLPVSVTLKSWTVTSIFAVGLFQGRPELQSVIAQETGMPGMPQTGSDPQHSQGVQSDPQRSWLWVMTGMLLIVLSTGIFCFRKTVRVNVVK